MAIRAGGTLGGGLIGAGVGLAQAVGRPRDVASQNETYLRFKAIAADKISREDPTYMNKMKSTLATEEYLVEKANREHPGGRVAWRAGQGALGGALAGSAVPYVYDALSAFFKARKALRH